ncbi:NAD(P)-binding protein [Coprinopsis marcescibilis]|uniref:NAD(P)-binding protein n=1 Tax=Coprinopsis marcescibilis TaxID=230819 RepID=A0A5C3L2J1_COPMA|nr:NAD(P)-binding protein [Coprinopsis marcescibilis]
MSGSGRLVLVSFNVTEVSDTGIDVINILPQITGVTGYIGGQVVQSFLEAGYRVRGYNKLQGLVAHFTSTANVHFVSGNLEFVRVDDLVKGEFTDALRDVHAVIHVASPLPGRTGPDETIAAAVEGTLNVLRQAQRLGIKKFVVTGSTSALYDHAPGKPSPALSGLAFTEKDWGAGSREGITAHAAQPFYVYASSKYLAEKAVWEFARAHPELDVSTVLPSFVYGPYSKSFPYPASYAALQGGTNAFPYAILKGKRPPVLAPWVTDVRDVAKAHVRALELASLADGVDVEERRFIVSGGNLTWKEAARYLGQALPTHLASGITDPEELSELSGVPSVLDTSRAREVLGIEFIDPKKTLEECLLSLVSVEEGWATNLSKSE